MTPSAYRRKTEAYEIETCEIRARCAAARTPADLIASLAGMSPASAIVQQDNKIHLNAGE